MAFRQMLALSGKKGAWTVSYEHLYQLFLVIVVFGSYYNALFGAFIWDDRAAIIANEDVTGKRPWYSTFSNDFWGQNIRLEDSHKSYRPITTLTYRLDHELYGLSAFGFHLSNVVVYAVCCLAFYRLACHWLSKSGACVAGLLFAVHPIHVEAVASIVGRADCLCGLFYILATLSYQQTLDSNDLFYFFQAWVFAMLATFSKEVGFTIFAMFGVLEVLHQIHAVMRQHPDFRWLRVTGELVRKKNPPNPAPKANFSLDGPSASVSPAPVLFHHPEELLVGLLADNSWGKSWLILSTALESRLNIFMAKSATAKASSTVASASKAPSTWSIRLRPVPLFTWFRLLVHILTVLLFFQFRAWLHGPKYMYQWTIMENHVALMPTFFPDRVLSYAQHHFWYFWKFVYPRYLCFDYGFECIPVVTSLWDWRNLLPLSVYALVLAAIVHAVYHLRLTLLFGWALWLSALLPALNILIPVGSLLAERLMFVPSIGFCILVAEYVTVDGASFWFTTESYLWAALDAFESFTSVFLMKWEEAVTMASGQGPVGGHAEGSSDDDATPADEKKHKKRKGAQHDTGHHPQGHHHNQHLPKHPLTTVQSHSNTEQPPRGFHFSDGLSVYINQDKQRVRKNSSYDDVTDSVTDGEHSSVDAERESVSGQEGAQKVAKSSSAAAAAATSSSSGSGRSTTRRKRFQRTPSLWKSFGFLWDASFWWQSMTTFASDVEAKAEYQQTQHPSAVIYQGKMALVLLAWPVLALATMRIISRNVDWHSELSIYSSALKVCPRSLKALSNTAVLLSSSPSANNISAQYANTCMEIYQNSTVGLINQGLAQQRLGHSLNAVMALERSLVATYPVRAPYKAEGYLAVNLFKWAMKLPVGITFTGRPEDDVRKNMLREAHRWSIEGINRGFQSPLMFYNAASMAVEVGELNVALTLYEHAIQTQRRMAEQFRLSGNTLPQEDNISLRFAYNMYAVALAQAQRYEDAILAYQISGRLHAEEDGGTDPFPTTINMAQLLNHHLQRPADARDVLHKYLQQYQFESAVNSSDWAVVQPLLAALKTSSVELPLAQSPSEWPTAFGVPDDWLLLALVRPSAPAILWNNLGHIMKQMNRTAVAVEYFAHGLNTAYRAQSATETSPGGKTQTQVFDGMVVPSDLPVVLLDSWKTTRRALDIPEANDTIPAEWEALMSIPMF